MFIHEHSLPEPCLNDGVQMGKMRTALTPGSEGLLQKGRRLTEHTLDTCQLKRVKAAAVRPSLLGSLHAFFHLLICSCSPLCIHSFTHSFTHSFIHSFLPSIFHLFIVSCIHSSLICPFNSNRCHLLITFGSQAKPSCLAGIQR